MAVTDGAEIAVPEPPVTFAHPTTAEVIAVVADTATDVLADARDALVTHEADVRSIKQAIDRELTRRLDYEGTRSTEIDGGAGRFKLTGQAPTKVEWDGELLAKKLRSLVRAGLISKERAGACVERVVTYKAKHGELVKLAKHADERVRAAVEAGRREVDVPHRTVSVTRKADR